MAIHAVARATNLRKTAECHVCSRADDVTYLTAQGYRIVQCRSCGLWYMNPQPTPEQLRQFYADYHDGEQWRKLGEHFNRAIRSAILRRKNSGSVLDADLKRNLGKLLVRWVSQTLYYLSFRRVVVGYSTLVLAQKVSR